MILFHMVVSQDGSQDGCQRIYLDSAFSPEQYQPDFSGSPVAQRLAFSSPAPPISNGGPPVHFCELIVCAIHIKNIHRKYP